MHYPHRISRRKRVRKFGFLARMRSSNGRSIINRRRARKRQATIL
ncbi:MAG TPA: 50S ribosomal protein L34 [Phycisphaerae bacterium]|nr:50S ribosomal protein L34 [Phycisphaerae bacterium]HPS52907.1 50S ribosomal protein L34 [Phycisphaerae bacterium]